MSTPVNHTILTIGHSNHPPERLVELLDEHDVTLIADVRSTPYSRLHPDFNREALQRTLDAHNIAYVFLGHELGARSNDPSCYEDGKVQYRKLAQTDLFRAGVERVLADAESSRVALLCAEKDPLTCHRSLLIARELDALGAKTEHILADGSLESHADALARLLTVLKMPQADLFLTREQLIEDAYARQEQRIAYTNDAMSPPTERESE